MENLNQHITSQFIEERRSCAQAGVNELNEWDLHGVYDEKFDDPSNFNLGENMVSLITACAVSFSLLFFIDIVFRIVVRNTHRRVNHQMLQRHRVLETFSNPMNLLAAVFSRIRAKPFPVSQHTQSHTQNNPPKLPKFTHGALIVMGAVLVCVEFVLIFLATNQHKVYQLQPDSVPIFEFDDRGCEFVRSPVQANSCEHIPLTEKTGFDLRASVQLCERQDTFRSLEGTAALLGRNGYLLFLTVMKLDFVKVTVMDGETASFRETRIGILFEQTGYFYAGMQNVSTEQLLSVFQTRVGRTNLTLLYNSSSEEDDSEGYLQAQVTFLVDASEVDLQETHMFVANIGNNIDQDEKRRMHIYLHDVMRSIMFPTARSRGVRIFQTDVPLTDGLQYLDEDSTPLAYYNRPWIGVVPSLIMCFVLLSVWTVLAALGIEGGVDSRLEGARIYHDRDLVNPCDLENGVCEVQETVTELRTD